MTDSRKMHPMQFHFSVYRWTEPNAGDVALFEGLKSLFPINTIWTEIDLWTPFDVAIEKANSSQGLIIGGGTILGNLATWVLDPEFTNRLNVPLALIGTGIRDEGRLWIDEEKRTPLASLLSLSDPSGLRGALSHQFLIDSDLGLSGLNVTGDTALAIRRAPVSARGIGINIRPRPGGEQYSTIAMCQKLLESGALELFGPIEFFSCHNKWDLQPADELGVFIEPYTCIDDFLKRLGGYEIVISERLHGAVLAHALGRPVVQLSYERKCLDYMASMDCDDLCLQSRAPDELIEMCLRATESSARFVPRVAAYRNSLQIAADQFMARTQGFV
jgi:hypothetical protein